jgi:Ca2+-binding EF-hand superfamily protein
MKKIILTAIVISPLLLISCSNSNSSPSRLAQAKQRFNMADTNNDGRLSFEEFSHTRIAQASENPQTQFATADSDGNGYLSKSELRSALSKLRKLKNQ